jgi:hypothetical protein
MSSLLTQANTAYRSGDHVRALELYEQAFLAGKQLRLPNMLLAYCSEQIEKLEVKAQNATTLPNVILSACNSKFYHSLLIFLESLFLTNNDTVHHVFLLDFGLESWQLNVVKNIKNVHVFTYDSESATSYPHYARFKIEDPSTYFFKVYAFHEGIQKAREILKTDEINVLWLDIGNLIQKPLKTVFSKIEKEGYFFIDHRDVHFYYQNVKDCLVNVLSPSMFDGDLQLPLLNETQLRTPYIKANFFGIKICKQSTELLQNHRDICCRTDVLFDPRTITDSALKNYWKQQLKSNSDDFLYLYGRHEQSVWSYLVARYGLKIHDSCRFSYTVSAGSSTLPADQYYKRMKPKLESSFDQMQDSMKQTILAHTSPEHAEAIENLDKNGLIEKYLEISKKIYIDDKVYEGIGFPAPAEAERALVQLHRGCRASKYQYKYAGRLLNFAGNIRDEIFILLGNGPSLAEVDFHSLVKYDTFGLNAAYRAYDRLNFWPKYFGCFDALVCNHHASEFKKMILDSPIEKFFFINFDDEGNEIFTEPEVLRAPTFQRIRFQYREQLEKQRTDILSTSFERFVDMRTSGSNTIQAALLMGYRKFILLGVDQNYVEVVDGAKKDNSYHKLVMERTPDQNPNYWFADYQQKGDKFNRPNLTKSQIPAWNNLSMTLQNLSIHCEIYNCSPITQLDAFPKMSLAESLKRLESIRVDQIKPYRSPVQFDKFL